MENNNFVPQMGMDVIGSDGEKIGEIDAVEQDYFVVRKGWLFPKDHFIPLNAVDSYDDNAVYLNVSKDGALEQQWGESPATYTDESVLGTSQANTGYTATEQSGTYASDGLNTEVTDSTFGETRVDDRALGNADENQNRDTIEVREEDLSATTREVDRGAVRVDTHVVEEEISIDVPVTEEEVEISRRAVDRPVDGVDFQDATFEVPLKGEEVDVSKTARVVEEIDINKTARERTETVSDTIRRDEVDVTGDGVTVDSDSTRVGHRDDRGLLDKANDAVKPDDDKDRR